MKCFISIIRVYCLKNFYPHFTFYQREQRSTVVQRNTVADHSNLSVYRTLVDQIGCRSWINRFEHSRSRDDPRMAGPMDTTCLVKGVTGRPGADQPAERGIRDSTSRRGNRGDES